MFRDPRSSVPIDEVERFTTELVQFNAIFIRLAGPAEMGFSALSIIHTLYVRGPSRLSDLLTTERIKQPALSAAVAKLIDDGLVVKTPDPADGRASLLELTERGRTIVTRRHDTRVHGVRRLFDRLDDESRASIAPAIALLSSLLAAAGDAGETSIEEGMLDATVSA